MSTTSQLCFTHQAVDLDLGLEVKFHAFGELDEVYCIGLEANSLQLDELLIALFVISLHDSINSPLLGSSVQALYCPRWSACTMLQRGLSYPDPRAYHR